MPPWVGSVEPADKSDANGKKLTQMAKYCELVLVNTFYAAGPTYRTTGSPEKRVDYIAMSNTLAKTVIDCHADQDFQNGLKVQDHGPVVAAVSFTSSPREKKSTGAAHVRPDKAKYGGQEARIRYQSDLKMPTIEWEEDVNQHYQRVASSITAASEKAFAKTELTPVQNYISTTTMRLIRTRRHVQR